MPTMPKEWKTRIESRDRREVEALVKRIDDAMENDPAPALGMGYFFFNFSDQESAPNPRVQVEIRALYQKSDTVHDGWSSVEFVSDRARGDDKITAIKFTV